MQSLHIAAFHPFRSLETILSSAGICKKEDTGFRYVQFYCFGFFFFFPVLLTIAWQLVSLSCIMIARPADLRKDLIVFSCCQLQSLIDTIWSVISDKTSNSSLEP